MKNEQVWYCACLISEGIYKVTIARATTARVWEVVKSGVRMRHRYSGTRTFHPTRDEAKGLLIRRAQWRVDCAQKALDDALLELRKKEAL